MTGMRKRCALWMWNIIDFADMNDLSVKIGQGSRKILALFSHLFLLILLSRFKWRIQIPCQYKPLSAHFVLQKILNFCTYCLIEHCVWEVLKVWIHVNTVHLHRLCRLIVCVEPGFWSRWLMRSLKLCLFWMFYIIVWIVLPNPKVINLSGCTISLH